MNRLNHRNLQLASVWSMPVMLAGTGIGWIACARFFPPHPPTLGADEIANSSQVWPSMFMSRRKEHLSIGSPYYCCNVDVLSSIFRKVLRYLPFL